MENITSLFKTFLETIRENSFKIVAALVLSFFSALAFYLTLKSLKKLKPEAFSYYPFDRFFPQSTKWSVGYFLIVVIFLTLLLVFLIRGEFYLRPS